VTSSWPDHRPPWVLTEDEGPGRLDGLGRRMRDGYYWRRVARCACEGTAP
jgi:hypothetical protein